MYANYTVFTFHFNANELKIVLQVRLSNGFINDERYLYNKNDIDKAQRAVFGHFVNIIFSNE